MKNGKAKKSLWTIRRKIYSESFLNKIPSVSAFYVLCVHNTLYTYVKFVFLHVKCHNLKKQLFSVFKWFLYKIK